MSLATLSGFIIKDKAIEVNATQHAGNYADFTYSGTYYSQNSKKVVIDSSLTDGLNGTLRSELTKLSNPKSVPQYGSDVKGALSEVLQYADEDPTNSANMVLLYTRNSYTKRWSQSASNWNREHVWPQNLSNGCWGTTRGGSDLLHIRPVYETTNSTRGNHKYGTVSTSYKKTYDGMDYGYDNGSTFMPLEASKGDVARICMYVWTAYHEEYGSKLPQLTNVFESFDTMLKWHIADKPDALEGHRNEYAEKTSVQKNRNPFVDHPEYACHIFGSSASASVKNLCNTTYPKPLPEPGQPDPDDPGDNPSVDPSQESSFPVWAIALIVAGSVIAIGLAVFLVIFLLRRKRKLEGK